MKNKESKVYLKTNSSAQQRARPWRTWHTRGFHPSEPGTTSHLGPSSWQSRNPVLAAAVQDLEGLQGGPPDARVRVQLEFLERWGRAQRGKDLLPPRLPAACGTQRRQEPGPPPATDGLARAQASTCELPRKRVPPGIVQVVFLPRDPAPPCPRLSLATPPG